MLRLTCFLVATLITLTLLAVHAYQPPTKGVLRTAVILTEFADVEHSTSLTEIEERLKALDSYLKEVSYGQADPSFEVYGWFELPHTMEYYGLGIDFDDASRVEEFINDVVEVSDPYVDFSSYQYVLIIHAGGNEALSGEEEDIWSFALMGGVKLSTDDGLVEVGLSCTSEEDPLGVYAHEYGHMLGLPDLYGDHEYVGKWGLMGRGSWNGCPPGSSPAHMMAWSKIKLGWIPDDRVFVVNRGLTSEVVVYPIETPSTGYQAVKVPLTSTSYYLIEVREKVGFDLALPSEGVLISLCDDSLSTGQGIVKVRDAQPQTATLDDAAFNVDGVSEFIDEENGVMVRLLSRLNGAYRLLVSYMSPDLVVEEVHVEPLELLHGHLAKLTVKVGNKGNYRAGSFKVGLFIDGRLIAIFDVEGLSGGGVVTLSATWRAKAGRHEVKWVVDLDDRVDEAREDNNEACLTVEVKVKLLVHVEIEGVKVTVNGTTLTSNATGYVELHLLPGTYLVKVEDVHAVSRSFRLAFRGWEDGATDNPRAVKLRGHLELRAVYVKEYLVEVEAVYGEAAGGGWYEEGSIALISINPIYAHGNSTRRVFVGWEGDVVSPKPTVEVYVDGPKTLRARWKTQYACSFKFMDALGARALYPPLKATLALGSEVVVIDGASTVWLDAGCWRLVEVVWQGVDVKPMDVDVLVVDKPKSFTLLCRVYDLELSVTDVFGVPVEGAQVEVVLPNNTVVKVAASREGLVHLSMIPAGRFKAAVSFLWQRGEVEGEVPSPRVEVKLPLSALSLAILALTASSTLCGVAVYARRQRHKTPKLVTDLAVKKA